MHVSDVSQHLYMCMFVLTELEHEDADELRKNIVIPVMLHVNKHL